VVSARRRAREKENLRRAILDAARELFVSEDYEAVSMRRIADRIEYSPTAIYLHFKDKEEILFHLVEEGFAMLRDRLQALEIADPVQRLQAGGLVYLDFARTQPQYFHLMFYVKNQILTEKVCQLQNKQIGDLYGVEEEIGQNCFGFILRGVSEAIAQGQFAEGDPMVMSHVIWAHIHGAASLELSGSLFMLPLEAHDAFFHQVVDTTIQGLRPQS
jgi:AcrR family transcriptional regulator